MLSVKENYKICMRFDYVVLILVGFSIKEAGNFSLQNIYVSYGLYSLKVKVGPRT